jgi:predicted RNA methylase
VDAVDPEVDVALGGEIALAPVRMVLVITDLTTGTGRFNLAQGVLGAATGIAAAISTGAAGLIVASFGDFAGFMSMTIIVLAGTVLLWLFVPETKPSKYID